MKAYSQKRLFYNNLRGLSREFFLAVSVANDMAGEGSK